MAITDLPGAPHIFVTLDTAQPIEVGDFVSAFAAVASQYEKFVREHRPDLSAEAQMYVKEIRPGSIVADLIPFSSYALLGGGALISAMDQVLIVEQFVRLYGSRLQSLFLSLKPSPPAEVSSSDLRDLMGAVSAIANDPDGSAKIEVAF